MNEIPEREHTCTPDCWCQPTLFFDGGEEFGSVWVCKGPGDELPPTQILIQALNDVIRGEIQDD